MAKEAQLRMCTVFVLWLVLQKSSIRGGSRVKMEVDIEMCGCLLLAVGVIRANNV